MNILIPVRVDKKYIPDECNVLLLGTWALDSADIENKKFQNIVEYHYDDYDSLEYDFKLSKILYYQLIEIFSEVLNEYFSINWSLKSWKIYLGAWLIQFIQVLLG